MTSIEEWAAKNQIPVIKLQNPLSGEQIATVFNDTLSEIVSLMNNFGYEVPKEAIWAGKLEKFGIKALRNMQN